MEIDSIDEGEVVALQSQKSAGKRPSILPIDEAHPFDLEAYISGYKGTFPISLSIPRHKYCTTLLTR